VVAFVVRGRRSRDISFLRLERCDDGGGGLYLGGDG
jgi:hypothetical protein